MNIDIKPSKKAYLTPIIFLLVGGTIFFILITGLIRDTSSASKYLTPGDSITIEAEEDELFYIMIDTISRDDLSFGASAYHSSFFFYYEGEDYEVAFVIYEEGDTSNIVIAEELSENTSLSVNDYEAVMSIRFEEAGTYVIDTFADQPDFPEFSIYIRNLNLVKHDRRLQKNVQYCRPLQINARFRVKKVFFLRGRKTHQRYILRLLLLTISIPVLRSNQSKVLQL